MREIIIGKNDFNQRLDRFLVKAFPTLSQGSIRKAIRKNQIKVNGKKQPADYRLSMNDVLKLYLNDNLLLAKTKVLPTEINTCINIIYEDDNIIIIDKPQGLVVHEDNENTKDTLINRIIGYLAEKGDYNPSEEHSFTPALCNRIDRNTSGIVLAAKNAEALRIISDKLRFREITKLYLCIAVGNLKPRFGTFTAFLEKCEEENKVIISNRKTNRNKTIITKYHTIDSFPEMSLVEVELLTGRTHQIRAHLAYLGYPLLGDGKYGVNKINKFKKIKNQALCSYKIKFDFKTDAGILNYLKGKEYETNDIWFLEKYYYMKKENYGESYEISGTSL